MGLEVVLEMHMALSLKLYSKDSTESITFPVLSSFPY